MAISKYQYDITFSFSLAPIPEHFDSESVYSKATEGESFRTKNNEYRFAKSDSTKVLKTPQEREEVSSFYSRNTTLLLLAAKTKSWNVVKAILELDPEEFPNYLKARPNNKKHPLYDQDDSKANLLHMAIEDGQVDVCLIIIDIVDVYTLKNVPVKDKKTALALIQEKLVSGFEEWSVLKDKILLKYRQ